MGSHVKDLSMPLKVDAASEEEVVVPISRHDFPPHFTFGVATSALQIEGGASEGGRAPSIWDTFASIPGKISDGSTPAVACDHFNKFQEDILEMKRMGVDAYRFSISWPRLFPDGSGKVRQEGVAFYNGIINTVIEAGLIPYATIYHWDLPQFLEDDPEVKGWRTKNIISIYGYGLGVMAPGSVLGKSTEPYIVAHHQLLSHAAAVKTYRANYQKEQKGFIGFSAVVGWYEPLTGSQEDKDAAVRFQDFESAWTLDPVFTGDYPKCMRELVGDRLPEFTSEESEELKGSVDFIGVNYYTASYASNASAEEKEGVEKWWETDTAANPSFRDADGNLIGEFMGPPGLEWFRKCPWGLRKALAWMNNRYGRRIPLYITENGTLDPDTDAPLEVALDDQHRIDFIKDHLQHLAKSIREDKVNVKGYFLWTFMDDWEWMNGFRLRFGLYYVDFKDSQFTRYPKASAKWYSNFLLPNLPKQ